MYGLDQFRTPLGSDSPARSGTMHLTDFFQSQKWRIVETLVVPPRSGQHCEHGELGLSAQSEHLLESQVPKGIYLHQKQALSAYLEGKNVCAATGTASGKSLMFYIAAIENLVGDPDARILSIYPLRALAKEQEERWAAALRGAGIDARVGRIDGQVPVNTRLRILKDSRVLILTPDIIHAWLLSNLADKHVMDLLRNLSLVVVDEVHNYTGVFGSNSAFLFRRLQHVLSILGCEPRYIAASATIAQPELHLRKLLGKHFAVIDEKQDTSPRHKLTVRLVEPPEARDLLTSLAQLMEFAREKTDHKFLTFVDSRKQAEHITSIISRSQTKEDEQAGEEKGNIFFDHLERLSILPYRAGYEQHDRRRIEERLSQGTLTGVVSTSALELGIDISFLTLGILVGVPHSATSFYQRIGRIGRQSEGEIVVVKSGGIYNETIFRDPKRVMNMPLSEGALYLENPRIQYIHALCLARSGGEHDDVCAFVNAGESPEFTSHIEWPKGFVELCNSERRGLLPGELQAMKSQAGDDPNHAYPLRDVDVQFQVESRTGGLREFKGSLSYDQLMREAYPGAIYYYTTIPYRVCGVRISSRLVEVRNERMYTTKPQRLPTLVFPNITPGNIYNGYMFGELAMLECNLQIREAIRGFKERRGPNERVVDYPLSGCGALYFGHPRFARNYFTTGVIFSHPMLNEPGQRCDLLANLLFEGFLMTIPFERRDINYSNDKHRVKAAVFNQGDRFLCVYDQTYGSLRLSGRILEEQTLRGTFGNAIEAAEQGGHMDIEWAAVLALKVMAKCLKKPASGISVEADTTPAIDSDRLVKVIMPGSKGINTNMDNEEFFVEGVFFSPYFNGLAYRGCHASQQAKEFDSCRISAAIDSLKEIPGVTAFGVYNLETGELQELPGNPEPRSTPE